jgi:hypothetical protein
VAEGKLIITAMALNIAFQPQKRPVLALLWPRSRAFDLPGKADIEVVAQMRTIEGDRFSLPASRSPLLPIDSSHLIPVYACGVTNSSIFLLPALAFGYSLVTKCESGCVFDHSRLAEVLECLGAEGVGFEPTEQFPVRSISSRVPSTGLSHPSYLLSVAYDMTSTR